MDWTIVGFYIGLIIGISIHLLAFYFSIKNKENILSWLILINFLIVTFIYQSYFSLVLPIGYLIYLLVKRFRKKE